MRLSVLAVLPWLAVASLHAQEGLRQRLRECARVTVRLERLRCFDAVTATLPSEPRGMDSLGAEADWRAGGTGNWVVDEAINPMDDTRLVIVSLKATSGFAKTGEPVELVLRCLSGKTEVYLNWSTQLGKDGAPVTMRVGKEPAQTRRWGLSTDARESFYPGDDVNLIKELTVVDQLVVQVVPTAEDPITALFQLRGLSFALRPLRTVCGW